MVQTAPVVIVIDNHSIQLWISHKTLDLTAADWGSRISAGRKDPE